MTIVGCFCSTPALPKRISPDELHRLCDETNLDPAEVTALYKRFRVLAPKGLLNSDEFKRTLGIFGLLDDPFLADRMFRVFDRNEDGLLCFVEFISSLAVMIRGTEDEKLELSFAMLVGSVDAAGITFDSFQHLVRACSKMMQSLVAPLATPVVEEDIRQMFHEFSSNEGEDCSPVITLEKFKSAARTNSNFLRCLGLKPLPTELGENAALSQVGPKSPKFNPPQGYTLVQTAELSELYDRLSVLRDTILNSGVVLRDGPLVDSDTEVDRCCFSAPCSCANTARIDGLDITVRKYRNEIPCEFDPPDWMGASNLNDISNKFEEALHLCRKHVLGREFPTSSPRKAKECLENSVPHPHRTERRVGTECPQWDDPISPKALTAPKNTTKGVHRLHRFLEPKKGLTVHFAHENWNMVLSMMIGIRISVGRVKHEITRKVTQLDFIVKEKFSIVNHFSNIFDADASKRFGMMRFIDYAPMVFQQIRSSYGILPDSYIRSVGPEQLLGNMILGNLSSLSELSSEGKSGAFFYYTSDGRYMIKTVTSKEFKLLRRMLSQYYDHMMRYSSSLICRFLGLHCLRAKGAVEGTAARLKATISPFHKVYFIVMVNMFNTPVEIHRRYDLKGSWVGRETNVQDPGVALRDGNFKQAKEHIKIHPDCRDRFIAQIKNDTMFLRENNIIDYSLLLGIHDVHEGEEHMLFSEDYMSSCSTSDTLSAYVDTFRWGTMLNSVFLSTDKKAIYFMGIIDILTSYGAIKKLEHHAKGLAYDRRGISCCPPSLYASRFNDFIQRAFNSEPPA